MSPICLCQRPFTFPQAYVVFGCSCGEVWMKGRDRSGAVLWRNRIGVTAKALQLPRGEGISEGVSKRSAV
jgi:hypothetical protein